MAAMYARSNADFPRSPDQFTLERGQVSSPLPSATIIREYSRDQLLDFIREAPKQLRELHQRKSRRITNFLMKTLILVLHHPQLPSGLLCRLLGWPAGSTRQAMSTSSSVVTMISSRCLINILRRVAPPHQHLRSADFLRSPRKQERQRRHRPTPSRSVNSVAPPR